MAKTIEQRVRELEEKNRLLSENLIEAIWVVDAATMTYDYITPSIHRISGFGSQELVGKSIESRMTKASYEHARSVLVEAIAQMEEDGPSLRTVEAEMYHRKGHTYWVEISGKLVKEEGKPLKIIGITRDITQRKRSEEKQKKLIDQLSAALMEKERLLEENRMLREILPICSGCRRIRDEENRWWPLDRYVERYTSSNMSHTICPDCRSVLYDGL